VVSNDNSNAVAVRMRHVKGYFTLMLLGGRSTLKHTYCPVHKQMLTSKSRTLHWQVLTSNIHELYIIKCFAQVQSRTMNKCLIQLVTNCIIKGFTQVQSRTINKCLIQLQSRTASSNDSRKCSHELSTNASLHYNHELHHQMIRATTVTNYQMTQ
jgi:hypothetical protein